MRGGSKEGEQGKGTGKAQLERSKCWSQSPEAIGPDTLASNWIGRRGWGSAVGGGDQQQRGHSRDGGKGMNGMG